MANFTWCQNQSGQVESIINLDQVRVIADIGPQGCMVHMGSNITLKMDPATAKSFLATVAQHTHGGAAPQSLGAKEPSGE